MDTTQDMLDDLWKQDDHDAYPQVRMTHLLEIMGGTLGRAVQKKLGAVDVWKGSFAQVKENLRLGVQICEKWVQVCGILTEQFWKHYSPHQWKGDRFVPTNLEKLGERLTEVNDFSVNSLVNYFDCFLYITKLPREKSQLG